MGEIEPQSGSIEHLVPPFRLIESANGTNGFMLVGDSGETESLSHHLKVLGVSSITSQQIIMRPPFFLSRYERHCSIYLAVAALRITHSATSAQIVYYC